MIELIEINAKSIYYFKKKHVRTLQSNVMCWKMLIYSPQIPYHFPICQALIGLYMYIYYFWANQLRKATEILSFWVSSSKTVENTVFPICDGFNGRRYIHHILLIFLGCQHILNYNYKLEILIPIYLQFLNIILYVHHLINLSRLELFAFL